MNRQVAGNLDRIIATLEDEGTDGKETAAGASLTRSPSPPPGVMS
jgi:hypothetical protein